MSLYANINNRELPTLLKACYEINDGNMEAAVHDLETMNLLLGIIKNKLLINNRSRKKETRWSRGRNFQGVMEAVILRNQSHGNATDKHLQTPQV